LEAPLATEYSTPLTNDQLQQLLRIQRMRRAGFLPSILDVDFLLELVGLLLGGAR